MTYRPPDQLIVGNDGPVVVVSARVCEILFARGLDDVRARLRGVDAETDSTLHAMRALAVAVAARRSSARGTELAPTAEQAASSEWLTAAQAAELAGITPRGIRQAIDRQQLTAEETAQGWRIRRDDFDSWNAARAA